MSFATHPLMDTARLPNGPAIITLQYANNSDDPSQLQRDAMSSLLQDLFWNNQQIFASEEKYGREADITSRLREIDPQLPIATRMRRLYDALVEKVERDAHLEAGDLAPLDRERGPYLVQNYTLLAEVDKRCFDRFESAYIGGH